MRTPLTTLPQECRGSEAATRGAGGEDLRGLRRPDRTARTSADRSPWTRSCGLPTEGVRQCSTWLVLLAAAGAGARTTECEWQEWSMVLRVSRGQAISRHLERSRARPRQPSSPSPVLRPVDATPVDSAPTHRAGPFLLEPLSLPPRLRVRGHGHARPHLLFLASGGFTERIDGGGGRGLRLCTSGGLRRSPAGDSRPPSRARALDPPSGTGDSPRRRGLAARSVGPLGPLAA